MLKDFAGLMEVMMKCNVLFFHVLCWFFDDYLRFNYSASRVASWKNQPAEEIEKITELGLPALKMFGYEN